MKSITKTTLRETIVSLMKQQQFSVALVLIEANTYRAERNESLISQTWLQINKLQKAKTKYYRNLLEIKVNMNIANLLCNTADMRKN